METTRRQALLSGLFGAGALGLRALATGLPTWLLADPLFSVIWVCRATRRASTSNEFVSM